VSSEEYWEAIPKIQYHMDEPLADPAAIALYFVSQTASKYVKVSLSGEGADEFFGGYNIYHEPFDLDKFQHLPKGVRKGLANAASAVPFKFKGQNYLVRASKSVEERFIGNAFMFNESEREKLLKNPTGRYPHTELTKPFYDKVSGLDDVTKMQYIDINFWLIGDILLKADKMSMAHSLEVRVPFLDKKVFEVARHIPTQYKVNRQNTKYAMRLAANRHLPDEVADKKKLGFPVPIRIWIKDEKYYNMIKTAFTSDAAEKFFNTDMLMKYLDDHRAGKADNSRKVWTVYMFLVWYKDFFDAA
jgi:asparagine synthase (glutamine-hydrolysing)